MTKAKTSTLPGQVVLVMQGGGALGAFQAGVYEGLHQAGIEPDWVVGTSIGAINGVIIAGNTPANRIKRLREFWQQVSSSYCSSDMWSAFGLGKLIHNLGAVSSGIPGFFTPNLQAHFGAHLPLGISNSSYYSTSALRDTLERLVNFGLIAQGGTRVTLGAVNVESGRMRYFDSRDEKLEVDHVMASGALPPAFPAIEIDGQHYWDGGIYSNTPIEVVMEDNPRRNSVIFAAQLWQQKNNLPDTMLQVTNRLKDIQFASRAESHLSRQQQIHHLRHVVRELGRILPQGTQAKPEIQALLDLGCGTVMHVLPMQVPALSGEDHTKDLDFTPGSIRARWDAGREYAKQKILEAPWNKEIDPTMGIVVHP